MEEHRVPAHLVPTLFATGFLSGGASAYVTGTLADRHGRKAACLVFCVAYALSCACTTRPSLPLLFLGRVLGGVGTSLLFSVFESWMVTDFGARGLAARGGDLSRTFGLMSTLNSVVAIASGVFSEWVVGAAGTRKAPFVAAVGLLAVAFYVIWTRWEENYGDSAAAATTADKDKDKLKPPAGPKLWDLLKDPRIVTLGLASTMFEGSMYLFVFFWGPALGSAHHYEVATGKITSTSGSGGLPYGIVFASFMAAVLAASLAFNAVMDRKLVRHAYLLAGVLAAADVVFYALEQPRGAQATFWLFALFEACVGAYWPCMGYLKGRLVDDGARARLYAVLRVPLNVFVVVALYLTTKGAGDEGGDGAAASGGGAAEDSSHTKVFAVCSRLLLAAIGAMYAMIMNEEDLP